MKSVKQKLVEKLWRDFRIVINPDDLHSVKGRKEACQCSWSTIRGYPSISSELTMKQCLKLPLKIRPLQKEIIVDIDLDKLKGEHKC